MTNLTKDRKMKRYQLRRLDKRNTLMLKKYLFPMWFMMNVTTVIMLYIMVAVA